MASILASLAAAQPAPVPGSADAAQKSADQSETAAAPAPAPSAEEPRDDANTVECRSQKMAGSRIRSRKVCRTVLEWKAYEEDTRSEVRRATARHAQTPI